MSSRGWESGQVAISALQQLSRLDGMTAQEGHHLSDQAAAWQLVEYDPSQNQIHPKTHPAQSGPANQILEGDERGKIKQLLNVSLFWLCSLDPARKTEMQEDKAAQSSFSRFASAPHHFLLLRPASSRLQVERETSGLQSQWLGRSLQGNLAAKMTIRQNHRQHLPTQLLQPQEVLLQVPHFMICFSVQ